MACGVCGLPVPADPPGTNGNQSGWRLGHIKDRVTHPELTWNESNWRVEHKKCSDGGGQAAVIAKAKADALREAGFSVTDGPIQAAASEKSLSLVADATKSPEIEPNEDLLWTSHDLRKHAWLKDLADIPEDAAPPLYMTPIPPTAVCSYGWQGCEHLATAALPAVPWIEQTQMITMRWWQRLSLIRQLEHDAAGELLWRKKIESAPRRAGKSVGLRGGALWRMDVGPTLFGEPQNVIHTGSDLNICREVQRGAWNWAEGYGWSVTRGNGKEAVETDNARWLVRAQDGVYGYDCSLGLGDECWDVKPDTINEGLEPATLERVSPQLVLTSTAHRRATSLMRTELANALAITDPDVLLMLWGALATDDWSDPAVWRAASPFWSDHRERMIRGKYAAALAGQDDPEFDDPDPMRGFAAQYLNVWSIAEKRLVGKPVIEAEPWAELSTAVDSSPPDAVAVEAWFERGVAVAEAWRATDGTVTVRVTDFANLDDVARHVATLQLRRPVVVGTSLMDHPAWRANRVRTESASATTVAQVGELQRVLREGTFRHDGSPALTEQVLALRVSPGVNGPRIRSTERADAVKAAMWAASAAAAIVRRRAALPSRYKSA